MPRPVSSTLEYAMTDYILKLEPGNHFISPYGFVSYSKDFYEAAINHSSSRNFSPASFYLFGRSLELSFKAFLLLRGVTRKQLPKRSLGHDLEKILKKCQVYGLHNFLSLNLEEEMQIRRLNEWYCRKGFEYFEIENLIQNHKNLPTALQLSGLTFKLITAFEQVCKEAA